jgi:hypothetical protein
MAELPELVLTAASGIGEVDCAYDAELLLSTLLGSVYGHLQPDRGAGADSFATVLRAHLATSTEPVAPVVAAVLDALTGARSIADGPQWIESLGRVRVTGGYAYGDRYGDQTSYLATYAYQDERVGGPDHGVLVLVDHNLGTAQEVLLVTPVAESLAALREGVASDPEAMTWMAELDPAAVRAAATAYLRATDLAEQTPPESLAANRALALARLAILPEPAAPEPPAPGPPAPGPAASQPAAAGEPAGDGAAAGEPAAAGVPAGDGAAAGVPVADAGLVAEFLAAPEAGLAGLAGATGPRQDTVSYCLGLVVDFATNRGDPLRWSPRAVRTFLTEWVHQRALLDADDAAALPDVLAAWVTWAGHRIGLPETAIRRTFAEIGAVRPEFVRLCATGERQSPAAQAMARLVAEGVDLADEAAVEAWLRAYNAEL